MICNECETVAHCMKNGCVPKTTKKDEAMKLALEAYMAAGFGNSTDFALQRKAYDLALQALASEAIEQPAPVAEPRKQEPVQLAEKEDVESLKRQLSLQTSMCIAYKKENEQLLAANKDCINHFDALKADYDALRAQQEPVAWRETHSKVIKALAAIVTVHTPDKLFDLDAIPRDPVMGLVQQIKSAIDGYKPPQRTWVGLTDEQTMAGYKLACSYGVYESNAFALTEKMFSIFKEKNCD